MTFGAGALAEVGPRLRAHDVRRAAVFVDPRVHGLPWFAEVAASLAAAGVDAAVYVDVAIEPTDAAVADSATSSRASR